MGVRAVRLSGGMQKKLALACTLTHRPEILLHRAAPGGRRAWGYGRHWAFFEGRVYRLYAVTGVHT